MKNGEILSHENACFIRKTCLPTLNWLRRSIEVNQGNGSSGFYSIFWGWSPPYPETTGYLIPTLFDFAAALEWAEWRGLAESCAHWLCNIQLPNGAFPRGFGSKEPLVFDTGMILFGLSRAWRESSDEKYLEALRKAATWLGKNLGPKGCWVDYAYVPGHIPAYHSRVIWAILEANTYLQEMELAGKMNQALIYHTGFINKSLGVRNAGLYPGEAAMTHTLAYYLRGMLESAVLLNEKRIQEKITAVVDAMINLIAGKGRLAGSYDENWRGNYSFRCITGQAQFSILLARLYQVSGNPLYHRISAQLFAELRRAPCAIPFPGLQGGIPGSAPLWGKYQAFRWLNWAAKFYLDAALIQSQAAVKPGHIPG